MGGPRWYFRCPSGDCGRRCEKLYASPGRRLGCRQCLGLQYASVQQHDARLDQARRRPKAFMDGRAGLRGRYSEAVTYRLIMDAIGAL